MCTSLARRKWSDWRISRPTEGKFDSWTGESCFGKKKSACRTCAACTKAAKKTVVADEQIETDGLDAFQSDDEVKLKKRRVYESPVSGKKVVDQETQTVYSKYVLSAKVETMILKNEMSTSQDCKPKIVSSLSYDYISQDCDLMTHFVGLTPKQFEVLYGFLNDICPLEKINYWNFKESADSEKSTAQRSRIRVLLSWKTFHNPCSTETRVYHFPSSMLGSRFRWLPLAMQSLTRFNNSPLFPLCFNPRHFSHRFNCSTVYSSGSFSNFEPGIPSSSVRIVKDWAELLATVIFSYTALLELARWAVCLSESW